MLHGMKETYTEDMSSHWGNELPPVLPLRTRHKVSVTLEDDVGDTMMDDRKEQRHFARECLLISMTFYEFSKTCSQFP